MTTTDWFAVDKEGLAKLREEHGLGKAIYELVQNGIDTNATEVHVTLKPAFARGRAALHVEDNDPDGFKNLAHAYTLFAPSEKKRDPQKRGRFNLGEKLVLSLCESAIIISTKGSVTFGPEGRTESSAKTESGSQFDAIIRLTKRDLAEVERVVTEIIPPEGVTVTYNGEKLVRPEVIASFETILPTVIGDDLRPTSRKTTVTLFATEYLSSLYELGIPVVELPLPWHVDVGQKVPLNFDRDNVTPAYRAKLLVEIVNHAHHLLLASEAKEGWVTEALSHPSITDEAVKAITELRFGKKAVVFDPSSPESNHLAVAKGYTLVYGSSLPKAAWENVRRAEAVLPSSKVTPSNSEVESSADGIPPISREAWTEDHERLAYYTKRVARHFFGFDVAVEFFNTIHIRHGAWYGHRRIAFNIGVLGKRWFEPLDQEEVDRLLIHEFGHEICNNHLDAKYHDALCRLGAKLRSLSVQL